MQHFRLLVASALLFLMQSVHAGVIWSAIALDAPTTAKLREDPEAVARLLQEEPQKDRSVDLDKAWHAIHFLLTGSNGPTAAIESNVILGGKSLSTNPAYGPARLLSAPEVHQISTILERLPTQALAAKYDPRAMEVAKIYPEGMWAREVQEALQYLLHSYARVRSFYMAAAERGDAVLVFLE